MFKAGGHFNSLNREGVRFIKRVAADGGVVLVTYQQAQALINAHPGAGFVFYPVATKVGKLYALVPETAFDFVRGTGGSYVGQDGLIRFAGVNEPRIDWSTGIPVLLIEGAATNLIQQSADITNPYWTASGVVPSIPAVQSPAVGQNFGLITENTANTPHFILAPFVARGTTGVPFTQYCYARSNGRRYLSLTFGFDSGNVGWVLYDLQNGVVHSNSPALGGASIQETFIYAAGADSYLCGFRGTLSGLPNRLFYVSLVDSPTGINVLGQKTYTGDGTSGIYVWGFDLKEGGFSSHIPAAGGIATRNADVATITPPAGISGITTLFEDGSSDVITVIPALFQIPTGRIESIIML